MVRMAAARHRHACDRHVVVADRFYLFNSEIFGKPVEFAEKLIQAADDLIGLHAGRYFSEADDIRKDHGRILEMIRDIAFSIAQARGDVGREHVSE